ncbi:MAG: isoprenyl transferase [Candidatus Gastranaerophilales bacterium]|nr:isoprenyl transferase [Candidatus Gastranaerophilales bacterium]
MINSGAVKENITELVKQTRLQHVAIIMDGNRRWAKLHGVPSAKGHSEGVKSLKNTVYNADKWGIKYLTVYAFSTENWGRQPDEVKFLMFLLAQTLKNELNELHQNNVKITIIGDKNPLNKDVKNAIDEAEEKTVNNTGVHLQIALNYGSKGEIVTAVKKIALKIKENKLLPEDIDEDLISDNLYTANTPNPDLAIRTGGEMRLSNYLLWQLAYAEIYVTKTLWPDFNKTAFEEAIQEFAHRNRRFGKD